jgi:hypothetical protein
MQLIFSQYARCKGFTRHNTNREQAHMPSSLSMGCVYVTVYAVTGQMLHITILWCQCLPPTSHRTHQRHSSCSSGTCGEMLGVQTNCSALVSLCLRLSPRELLNITHAHADAGYHRCSIEGRLTCVPTVLPFPCSSVPAMEFSKRHDSGCLQQPRPVPGSC